MNSTPPPLDSTPQSLYDWTQIIYGLHALSLVVGIVGVATVFGSFLIGWPSLIAVVMNYIKRSEARGTWLESHFRWQINTFWFGAICAVLGWIFIVVTFGLGVLIALPAFGILSLWFIYRIARGWMALRDRKPMYS